MDQRVSRCLLLSQFSLFLFLGICITVIPQFLLERNEGGVSNYGVHGKTVVPFTFAFLLCGVFILIAAHFTPVTPKVLNCFRSALFTLGFLFLFLLATTYPYKANTALKEIHIGAGIVLFLFEMAMAVWLALLLVRDRINVSLLTLQSCGFLLACLTLIGMLHVLFVSQLVGGLAFGALLVRSGSQLVETYGVRP